MVATILGYFYPFERGRPRLLQLLFQSEFTVPLPRILLWSAFFPVSQLIAATCISAVVFVLATCGDSMT